MGYPELKSDETIVLTAQHIKVKSVPFELVLTNRRLILIDSEKNVVPTQQIPLMTIRNVMTTENAIRDPVITLTILTDTADTREMALTFAMQTAGERKREAGEWVKTLKKCIAEASSYPVEMPTPEPTRERARQEAAAAPGIKKKIEIARPIKKIAVDTSHLPPKPVETTSLPEGSFCGRCGNRIPPGSTFCNRCGTKVVVPDEQGVAAPAATPGQISTAPAFSSAPSGDHKGRPIEQIIHSIEPLIEDSVPRTETSPAVPEPEHTLVVPPIFPPSEAPASPAPKPFQEDAVQAVPGTPAEGEAPVATPPPADLPPLPPVPEAPRKKRSITLVAGIILVIVIVVAAGGFMVLSGMQKTTPVTAVPTTTPVNTTTILTTVPTTVVTTIETTAVPTTAEYLVPTSGIWVKVSYDKEYTGLIGSPGNQDSYTATGENLYRVRVDNNGTVAVSLQKTDGSGDELEVTIYKDGTAVKTASTSAPKGKIDLQFVLATPTPTPTPTETVTTVATTEETSGNTSVNSTSTSVTTSTA